MIPSYAFIMKDFTQTQIFFRENRSIMPLPLLNFEGMSIFCNHMSLLVWKALPLMVKLHKVFS